MSKVLDYRSEIYCLALLLFKLIKVITVTAVFELKCSTIHFPGNCDCLMARQMNVLQFCYEKTAYGKCCNFPVEVLLLPPVSSMEKTPMEKDLLLMLVINWKFSQSLVPYVNVY